MKRQTYADGIRSQQRRQECRLLSLAALLLLLVPPCSVALSCWAFAGPDRRCFARPRPAMATLGGARDSSEGPVQNSLEIQALARFAVDEHNRKANALAELSRVVNAKEQVVAGTLHHLTLEVLEAGQKRLYEAKVWVKPWMDFRELQEFKLVGDHPDTATVFTAADLGAKISAEEGWRAVPAHDPVVQEAAAHALKTIQERSNSLLPYELLEVIHSKAEVVEETAKFDMLLKVKRGNQEEKFKVEVHKNLEGNFLLNQIKQEH